MANYTKPQTDRQINKIEYAWGSCVGRLHLQNDIIKLVKEMDNNTLRTIQQMKITYALSKSLETHI